MKRELSAWVKPNWRLLHETSVQSMTNISDEFWRKRYDFLGHFIIYYFNTHKKFQGFWNFLPVSRIGSVARLLTLIKFIEVADTATHFHHWQGNDSRELDPLLQDRRNREEVCFATNLPNPVVFAATSRYERWHQTFRASWNQNCAARRPVSIPHRHLARTSPINGKDSPCRRPDQTEASLQASRISCAFARRIFGQSRQQRMIRRGLPKKKSSSMPYKLSAMKRKNSSFNKIT